MVKHNKMSDQLFLFIYLFICLLIYLFITMYKIERMMSVTKQE